MINHFKLILCLALITLVSGCARANEKYFFPTEFAAGTPVFYVAATGNDTATGASEDTPLATVAEAIKRLKPATGGVIRILPGALQERITISYQAPREHPLIIEGAISSDGVLLSAIDGARHVDAALWQRRPEMGPGVYSYPFSENEPGLLLVNGKMVARLNPDGSTNASWKKYGNARDILKTPEDWRVATRNEGDAIAFWEVMGGVFTPGEGEFYLRLHGEKNPAQQDIAIASTGAVVTIEGAQNVTVRNLVIKGGEYGAIIGGKNARGNVLEQCYIPHGRCRVLIADGAKDTLIQKNKIEMGFIGQATGAWGEGYGETTALDSAQAKKRSFVYSFFKYWASKTQSSQDWSVQVEYGAKDIDNLIIRDNLLEGGLIGISIGAPQAGNFLVENNTVRNFSSVGTVFSEGTYRLIYDGNLFADSNINIRIHHLGLRGNRDVYILRNTSLLPQGFGTHLHNHTYSSREGTAGKEYPAEHLTIYHNNFIGGNLGMALGTYTDRAENVSEDELNQYKFHRVLNNNFINCAMIVNGTAGLTQDASRFGVFDYNLIVGGRFNRSGKPAWWGEHNVLHEEFSPDWKWDMTQLTPPADTAQRAIGIDVSKSFTISGKTYDPLPVLKPGYFAGVRPLTGWPQ